MPNKLGIAWICERDFSWLPVFMMVICDNYCKDATLNCQISVKESNKRLIFDITKAHRHTFENPPRGSLLAKPSQKLAIAFRSLNGGLNQTPPFQFWLRLHKLFNSRTGFGMQFWFTHNAALANLLA